MVCKFAVTAGHFWVPIGRSALPKCADNETGNNGRVTDPSQTSPCPKISQMLPRGIKCATRTPGFGKGRVALRDQGSVVTGATKASPSLCLYRHRDRIQSRELGWFIPQRWDEEPAPLITDGMWIQPR